MSTTEILREEVTRYLSDADEKTLRMVQAILDIELGMDWDDMPEELQAMLDRGIKQGDEDGGMPHEEMVKKYPGLAGPLIKAKPVTLTEAICEDIRVLMGEVDDKALRIIKAILVVHEEFTETENDDALDEMSQEE